MATPTFDILGLDPSAPQPPTAHTLPPTDDDGRKKKKSKDKSKEKGEKKKRRASEATSTTVPEEHSDADTSDDAHATSHTWTDPGHPPTPPTSFTRSTIVTSQMSLRSNEYHTTKPLSIFLGTWNVNAKKPRDEDGGLEAWLLHGIKRKGEEKGKEGTEGKLRKAPDLYAIGFQEIVDLNASNLLVDHTASRPWEDFIHATLAATGKKYVQIATVHLVGLSLVVYVKEKHYPHITDVRTSSVGVGIMGVGGNKGGVAIRFKAYKSTVCIVNSHLAAHQNNIKGRNDDYRNICRRAVFVNRYGSADDGETAYRDPTTLYRDESDDEQDMTHLSYKLDGGGTGDGTIGSIVSSKLTSFRDKMMGAVRTAMGDRNSQNEELSLSPGENGKVPGLMIHDHDYIYWIGDNNYRLNVTDMDRTHTLIQEKRYGDLLKVDQLVLEKASKNCFHGFTEPPIAFPPTYKYIAGTHEYDRREDKKVRFPAWCDRIQFRSMNRHNPITAHYYTSAPSLRCSDHKPVMALCEMPVVQEIESRKAAVKAEVESRNEKELWPKMTVSATSIDFGAVRFGRAVERTISLKNVGKTVIVFRCLPESKSSTSLPPWLTVKPALGLLPMNATVTLRFTVRVERGAAHDFVIDKDRIDRGCRILLEGGRTYDIPFQGEYLKSILGCKLVLLNILPGPVRGSTIDVLKASTIAHTVPRVLYHLLNTLQPTLATRQIYTPPAVEHGQVKWSSGVHRIIESMDTGAPLPTPPEVPLVDYFHAVLYLLVSLHTPIFSCTTAPYFLPGMDLSAWCEHALMDLNKSAYASFVYIMSWAREVVKSGQANGVTPEFMSAMLAPAITHRPASAPYSPSMSVSAAEIIKHMLTTTEFTWDDVAHPQA